jgi:cytochrome c peroxidase
VHYPWYATLPIAGDVIRQDARAGLEAMDLDQVFRETDGGRKPISAVKLNEIEYVIVHDKMPLMKYKILHWNAFLSAREKQLLLTWIQGQRQRQMAPGEVLRLKEAPLKTVSDH